MTYSKDLPTWSSFTCSNWLWTSPLPMCGASQTNSDHFKTSPKSTLKAIFCNVHVRNTSLKWTGYICFSDLQWLTLIVVPVLFDVVARHQASRLSLCLPPKFSSSTGSSRLLRIVQFDSVFPNSRKDTVSSFYLLESELRCPCRPYLPRSHSIQAATLRRSGGRRTGEGLVVLTLCIEVV